MSDQREQLIALCQMLNLSRTIKDDPAELIDAVLVENARINAENVRLKKLTNSVIEKRKLQEINQHIDDKTSNQVIANNQRISKLEGEITKAIKELEGK